jgi:hypothetical protein
MDYHNSSETSSVIKSRKCSGLSHPLVDCKNDKHSESSRHAYGCPSSPEGLVEPPSRDFKASRISVQFLKLIKPIAPSLIPTLNLHHRSISPKAQRIPQLELVLPLPPDSQPLPTSPSSWLVRRKSEIEPPQHVRECELQLQIRQVPPTALPRADTERVESFAR